MVTTVPSCPKLPSSATMSEPVVYSLHAVDHWLTCSCSDLDELVRTSTRGAGVRECGSAILRSCAEQFQTTSREPGICEHRLELTIVQAKSSESTCVSVMAVGWSLGRGRVALNRLSHNLNGVTTCAVIHRQRLSPSRAATPRRHSPQELYYSSVR